MTQNEVTPDHVDVLTWEDHKKRMANLSSTDRAAYLKESQELWEKQDDGPPRMFRTFHGAIVKYDSTVKG